jgi:SAM-dependent methyltransferase
MRSLLDGRTEAKPVDMLPILGGMDERRRDWLAERRAAVIADYDKGAATYHDELYPVPLHEIFVRRLADLCPPGGLVLDAPCGTGRYFPIVTAAGRRVVGVDQSAGMLAAARARGLAEATEQAGLQELTFTDIFDGAMTIDAMENVPPEDWPLVLANLHRAVRPGGHLYLTVEEVDQAEIDSALAEAQRQGLPVVEGEVAEGDTAGYHYYPGRDRVLSWLEAEGLTVVDEAVSEHDGWAYRHFLVRSGSG